MKNKRPRYVAWLVMRKRNRPMEINAPVGLNEECMVDSIMIGADSEELLAEARQALARGLGFA